MNAGATGRTSAWFALWVLILVTQFAFIDRQILALLTVPVANSLHLRDVQIGLIQGLGSAVFAMIATFPLGWLADRYDRRWVLSGSLIVWAAGTAACGLAHGFPGLFIAVVAIAAGEAGLPSLAYSAIPDLFRGPSRITANQIFYLAQIMSAAAGLALGGAASAALDHLQDSMPHALQGFEHWRLVFFIVAAPAPLLIGLIAPTRLGRRSAARAVAGKAAEAPSALLPYLRAHGGAAALVITALCAHVLPFGALFVWMPAALTRLFGVTPAQNGLGLGVALAVGCGVGVGVAAWLMRRLEGALGGRAALRICWCAMLASLPAPALLMFVTSPWQAYALFGLLCVAGTVNGSLMPGIIQGFSPAKLRGRMTALNGVCTVITSGIGVTLVGPISDALGRNAHGILIGLTLLFTIFWGLSSLLMKLSEQPFQYLLDHVTNWGAEVERSGTTDSTLPGGAGTAMATPRAKPPSPDDPDPGRR